MPIGIDLHASRAPRILLHAVCLAFIAWSSACNAVVNFDGIDLDPSGGGKAGTAGKANGGDGGRGGRGDQDGGAGTGGDGGSDMDGSVTNPDGGSSDASTPDDSGMDASVQDAGDHDSGNGHDAGPTCELVETCDNGVDDNCDSLSDCDDPTCVGQANCCSATPEQTALECGDQKDNDCNGRTDCLDPHCADTLTCCTSLGAENNTTACVNGLDDDCDGKFDCADPDCAGLGTCCPSGGALGEVSGCCTPDGLNETDQPNDGKDNDCDGLIDIPILMSAFPTEGLPTSGAEVRLTFMTEIDASATLSCSTTRPGQPQAFGPCAMDGMSVAPFTALQSSNPMNNGLWITQVRWDFPGGKHSSSYTFRYYIHSSLHGVAHCTPFHTDTQWFNLAHTRLGSKDAGAFKKGVDTWITNPFVQVKYQVPISAIAKYMLNGQTPSIDMWSLRRRFTLNANNRYLLITRNYKATRSGRCTAGSIRVHITHWATSPPGINKFHSYSCDAIAINRAGVGVCMDKGATSLGGPVFTASKDSWDGFPLADWSQANKFMWRNLMEDSNSGPGYFIGGRNFTSKCSSPTLPANCAGIFLPDRDQFSP